MTTNHSDVLVIGAGNIGIACAYYLKKAAPNIDVTMVDSGPPMGFTSAQSGENYRNWWPSPVMRAFMDRSITLMEDIARETDNAIQLSRRGYLLATRARDIDAHVTQLERGYEGSSASDIRFHKKTSGHYSYPTEENWEKAPDGVDILSGQALCNSMYPYLAPDVENLIHIRRAGMLSGQQLGSFMLGKYRSWGGALQSRRVTGLEAVNGGFKVQYDGAETGIAERVINAAGPFAGAIAEMLGVTLPVENWLQQKIAFEDRCGAIERTMPFVIDMDPQFLDFTEEERLALADDPSFSWLANELPGAVHCRPEGGVNGTWIKLGWAYNQTQQEATIDPVFDDQFPEIVLRGAARLHPKLKQYYENLPRGMAHYGGYYTLTKENWPLIGATKQTGLYVAAAFSGFGTMAACAAGELVAQQVLERSLPSYASRFSPLRYDDAKVLQEIKAQGDTGIL